jgi:hypothetical protein
MAAHLRGGFKLWGDSGGPSHAGYTHPAHRAPPRWGRSALRGLGCMVSPRLAMQLLDLDLAWADRVSQVPTTSAAAAAEMVRD